MIAVGVDPGKSTGIAVWDCEEQKVIALKTLDFWGSYKYVAVYLKANYEKILVRVEDPRGNLPVFDRGNSGAKRTKIAQNVGGNKKEAELLIEGFRKAGMAVQPIVPKASKWSHDMFKKITGYKGRSNEHNRDAARMVVGLRAMPPQQYNQLIKEEI